MSLHDKIVIKLREKSFPLEVVLIIFKFIPVPILHETLQASYHQLLKYTSTRSFISVRSQLSITGGYKIEEIDKIIYKFEGNTSIADPDYWFLCKPIYISCLLTCFKLDTISFLQRQDRWQYQNIVKYVANNRLDLLKIVYQHTNVFCSIPDLVDWAVFDNKLEITRFLVLSGSSSTSLALDRAASNGNLEMVQFLYFHYAKASEWVLFKAASSGDLNVVRFLVENSVGLKHISSAIRMCELRGFKIVSDYLKDVI